LDRHERTHTKVRPYRCEACEKHFVRRYRPSSTNSLFALADGNSDTLKRHQKLHLAEADKPPKRSAKSGATKRSSGRGSDASRSDISLESPVDKEGSPSVGEAEVEAPQFSEEMTTVYALDAWNFDAVDVLFPGFAVKEEETMENLFEESFGPFEDGSIESRSMDFTINPGDIWGNL
jgi:hypothetical protein